MKDLANLCHIVTWFTTASVIPWAGALAAIIAALTAEPRTWLKSPVKSIGRALIVTVVWLFVAWVLCAAAQRGSGQGSGEGKTDGPENGRPQDPGPEPPPIIVTPGQFPPGTPVDVDLFLKFIPSMADSSQAQDFSCDLLYKSSENNVNSIQIRAHDMHEFDKLLIQQLRNIGNQSPRQLTILIARSPFPGENVLRQVEKQIRVVLPTSTISFDE